MSWWSDELHELADSTAPIIAFYKVTLDMLDAQEQPVRDDFIMARVGGKNGDLVITAGMVRRAVKALTVTNGSF